MIRPRKDHHNNNNNGGDGGDGAETVTQPPRKRARLSKILPMTLEHHQEFGLELKWRRKELLLFYTKVANRTPPDYMFRDMFARLSDRFEKFRSALDDWICSVTPQDYPATQVYYGPLGSAPTLMPSGDTAEAQAWVQTFWRVIETWRPRIESRRQMIKPLAKLRHVLKQLVLYTPEYPVCPYASIDFVRCLDWHVYQCEQSQSRDGLKDTIDSLTPEDREKLGRVRCTDDLEALYRNDDQWLVGRDRPHRQMRLVEGWGRFMVPDGLWKCNSSAKFFPKTVRRENQTLYLMGRRSPGDGGGGLPVALPLEMLDLIAQFVAYGRGVDTPWDASCRQSTIDDLDRVFRQDCREYQKMVQEIRVVPVNCSYETLGVRMVWEWKH